MSPSRRLGFGRHARRSAASLTIGIIYRRALPASRKVAEQVVAEIEEENLSREGPPVRYGLIDVSAPSALAAAVAHLNPNVLYVAPLAGFDVARIWTLSRAGKIRTATAVPAFVESGLAVGFTAEKDGPRILINREASQAEGADFSAKVLKLARLVP